MAYYIPILVGSTRRERQTIKVARFVLPIPENLSVSRVHDSFNEDGTPNDPAYEKSVAAFLDEVLWFAEAITDRKAKEKAA